MKTAADSFEDLTDGHLELTKPFRLVLLAAKAKERFVAVYLMRKRTSQVDRQTIPPNFSGACMQWHYTSWTA